MNGIDSFVLEAEDIGSTYLAYDIHSHDSRNLASEVYITRLVMLNAVVAQLRQRIPIE